MSGRPSLSAVLNTAMRERLRAVRVALPARVESYDATTQQIVAQPLVMEGYIDETGDRLADRLPAIAGVPVVFPGAGGFRVTFPIAIGDTVLLVFASSSIDRWLALGGEVDPADDRRHALSDAIAIPGLRDFAHALGNAPSSTMSIGKDGGPTIEISGTDVQIGGSNNLVTKAEFMAHVHATAGTGTPSPPTVTIAGTQVLKGG